MPDVRANSFFILFTRVLNHTLLFHVHTQNTHPHGHTHAHTHARTHALFLMHALSNTNSYTHNCSIAKGAKNGRVQKATWLKFALKFLHLLLNNDDVDDVDDDVKRR